MDYVCINGKDLAAAAVPLDELVIHSQHPPMSRKTFGVSFSPGHKEVHRYGIPCLNTNHRPGVISQGRMAQHVNGSLTAQSNLRAVEADDCRAVQVSNPESLTNLGRGIEPAGRLRQAPAHQRQRLIEHAASPQRGCF